MLWQFVYILAMGELYRNSNADQKAIIDIYIRVHMYVCTVKFVCMYGCMQICPSQQRATSALINAQIKTCL